MLAIITIRVSDGRKVGVLMPFGALGVLAILPGNGNGQTTFHCLAPPLAEPGISVLRAWSGRQEKGPITCTCCVSST